MDKKYLRIAGFILLVLGLIIMALGIPDNIARLLVGFLVAATGASLFLKYKK